MSGTDLLQAMRDSAHGARCEVCLFAGRIETRNTDGSPLVRCQGCQRMVCDRNPLPPDVPVDRRHLSTAHQPADGPTRRIEVTEVHPS